MKWSKKDSVKVRHFQEFDTICLTLCQELSPENYENIMQVTDAAKEGWIPKPLLFERKASATESGKTETLKYTFEFL